VIRPRYLARKLLWLLVTLFVIVTFNFLLFHVLPGDPVRMLTRSGHLTQATANAISELYGLNHPLPVQYLIYLKDLLHGNLGMSYAYREPVTTVLGQYLGNTVLLLAAATVLTIVVGTVAGVIAARRRAGAYDSATVTASVIGWALPTFWTGLILAFVLGVWVHAFPIFGMETPNAVYASPFQRAEDVIAHLFLPTVTLVAVNIAQFVLVARASVIEVLAEDFMLTATAKGLPPGRVLWRHAVRNALLPVVTSSALLVGMVVGGAIEVETVFSWPGMGLLVYNSVLNRDYPVIEASFLVFAVTVLLVNFVSDLLYQVLDPRVREA
jgi:peptide/nickel transport system permease protein